MTRSTRPTVHRELASVRKELSIARDDRAGLRLQIEALRAEIARLRGEREPPPTEYGRFVGRFRARLAEIVRPGAGVLVVSKGDDELLAFDARHAGHFPQAVEGGYGGSYPADDLAAVAHLEALRQEGYDTLVFPAFAAWWLERYAGFRAHLDRHYTLAWSDDLFSMFDLRPRDAAAAPPDPGAQAFDLLRETWRRLGRQPDVLDWASGLDLRERCPDYSVAVADVDPPLPHFDRSVDVVISGRREPSAIAEARRVATAAVVLVDADRVAATEWLIEGSVTAGIDALPEVPARIDGAPLVLPGPRDEALLVWTGEGVTLLPGWFEPIATVFERDPSAGAVGGRLLDFAGRLCHAGGVVLTDASILHLGEGDCRPGDPRYAFVREVDFCSSAFVVTSRRAFDEAGGFDRSLPAGRYRDADFGFRLRDRGYSVYYQPESAAVCSRTPSMALHLPPEAKPERDWRQLFAARWKSMLRSRRAAVDTYGASAYSRLPLVGPR